MVFKNIYLSSSIKIQEGNILVEGIKMNYAKVGSGKHAVLLGPGAFGKYITREYCHELNKLCLLFDRNCRITFCRSSEKYKQYQD